MKTRETQQIARCAALSAALLMASCGGVEQGKYEKGKNDPSLKVTDKDIAKVGETLDRQDTKDRAAGLRKETPNPHAGMIHPPEMELTNPGYNPGAAPSAPTPIGSNGKRIGIGSLWAIVPEGWLDKPPSSPMRLAEITIPPSAGDPEAGQISIFFFGPNQGGTVEMNLNRWYGQFEQPGGKDSKAAAHVESLKAGAMDVTFVDLSGTMLPSSMPGSGPQARQEHWKMLSAIIMSPEGPYFVKGTGPEKTMVDNKDKMIKFVTSFAGK